MEDDEDELVDPEEVVVALPPQHPRRRRMMGDMLTISADEAQALTMPLHQVAWTIDGYGLHGVFSCDAPHLSACRLVCAEGCMAESWPCSSEDDEYHRMRDGGECQVLLYLDELGAEESYDADAPTEAVRSGPVAVRWDCGDDGYVWSYGGDVVTRND